MMGLDKKVAIQQNSPMQFTTWQTNLMFHVLVHHSQKVADVLQNDFSQTHLHQHFGCMQKLPFKCSTRKVCNGWSRSMWEKRSKSGMIRHSQWCTVMCGTLVEILLSSPLQEMGKPNKTKPSCHWMQSAIFVQHSCCKTCAFCEKNSLLCSGHAMCWHCQHQGSTTCVCKHFCNFNSMTLSLPLFFVIHELNVNWTQPQICGLWTSPWVFLLLLMTTQKWTHRHGDDGCTNIPSFLLQLTENERDNNATRFF